MALARLKIRKDFLYVARGAFAARPGVVVQARPSPLAGDQVRIGFTASRKVGNAVARNRCKRRLREAARALLPLYGRPGWDYVFIARAGTRPRPWQALLDDVKGALISVPQKKTNKSSPNHRRTP
ncbi:MAG: ribonuclease P protein component [Robiginitomaculum sp.]|nr:ribonuclease P protein component [Robiginitomaculum sp.]MDQ7076810.1 ribonuclease P protein component [Robiginitomaculum sp.]